MAENGIMVRFIHLAAAAMALLLTAPLAAQEGCVLCAAADKPAANERPLAIEIISGLTFSRLALTGQGDASATIDPQSGNRQVSGGVVELGGVAVQGRGRITGTPNRRVRVDLPGSVTMTGSESGSATLTDFTTDLPAWPVLDSSGTLEFSFGGRLRIQGTIGGNLRGRIPITVDYN